MLIKLKNFEKIIQNFNEETEYILDVGTGYGETSIFLAKQFPDKVIISCEKYIDGNIILLKNIENNKIKNILLHNGNVYDVLKSENNFTSEISVDTYGEQYIKSVQTRKQVLNVIAADNNPGTKLEVILKVKDRIGFEDRDTLIVEYLSQKVKAVEISNPTTETLPTPTDFPIDIDQDNTTFSGIFVQGFSENAIKNIDAQIINSIIMSEIKTLGFQLDVFLETDIEGRVKPKGFNEKCNTDACIAKNARALNARYVIAWNFSQSIDNLSLRIFESIDHINMIEDADITGPYAHMNEVGIYGLESKLRSSVTNLMSVSNFKSEIPTLDRLIMKNESLISYSKYPLILGAAYLLVDKIFSGEEESTEPEMPPGFPHEQ